MKSQNGYAANDIKQTKVWRIPGTSRDIRLHKGDAGLLLVDFAAWFDKHIEDIEAGQLDDWGYASRNIRGSATQLSNHASGTAMDLNATKHPLGKRATFTAKQSAAIREHLLTYDGCIRWGGDYVNRADEMHFEINKPPLTVSRVAARLRKPDDPDVTITKELRAVAEKNHVTLLYLARVALREVVRSLKPGARKAAAAAALVALKPFK